MCGNVMSAFTKLLGMGPPKMPESAAVAQASTPRESDAKVLVPSEAPRPTGKVKLSGKKRGDGGLPGLGL